MGLFKKRSTDPAELELLRSEIAAMAARLDATSADTANLDNRLQHLATRVEQPPPQPPAPAAPPAPTVDPAELDMLRARIQRLHDRVESIPAPDEVPTVDPASIRALEHRVAELSAQLAAALEDDGTATAPVDPADVDALRDRIEQLQARLDAAPPAPPTPPPPPPAPAPSIDPAQLDAIRERIERLDERLAAVDARITSIATELANQLTELSRDVDDVAAQRANSVAEPAVEPGQQIDVEELVTELRDTQERLAREQARYQIAFRQELADLAERLRRG